MEKFGLTLPDKQVCDFAKLRPSPAKGGVSQMCGSLSAAWQIDD